MLNFRRQLEQLQQEGLLRKRRIAEGPQAVHLQADGKRYLAFCSNDYLRLAKHPRLIAAAHHALDEYGASASALISGYTRGHEMLEAALTLHELAAGKPESSQSLFAESR